MIKKTLGLLTIGLLMGQTLASGPMYRETQQQCEQEIDQNVVNKITVVNQKIAQLEEQRKQLERSKRREVCTTRYVCNIERYETTTKSVGCIDRATGTMMAHRSDCMYGGKNTGKVWGVTMEQAQQILDAGFACEDVTLVAAHCNYESAPGTIGFHYDGFSMGECGITYDKGVEDTALAHYKYALDSLTRAHYNYHVWIKYWNFNDKVRLNSVRNIKNFYNSIYGQ